MFLSVIVVPTVNLLTLGEALLLSTLSAVIWMLKRISENPANLFVKNVIANWKSLMLTTEGLEFGVHARVAVRVLIFL